MLGSILFYSSSLSPEVLPQYIIKCLSLHPLQIKPFIFLLYTNHPNACKVTYLLIYFNPLINFIYDAILTPLLLSVADLGFFLNFANFFHINNIRRENILHLNR